ncbi:MULTISPECIES: cell wall metabolism sensor histidine kinase WalK [unclassified Mycolicibacterium]|uniref:sensor histidine kinase n=1 Tax=unclassified Mycolicibacterium TaxID=2636767 RepID=UPI0012DFB7AC|nr:MULTISPECIES: HAMP domain-containing sensor histidine kinase [unclassified Mycolicibacterium]MUL81836.1 HAMP domain-containing histidine kinase [Mycolicibacterium sp. CBMA 329]MUL87602.1 HAMP domain-containing histidine kinase [Mycolicibacterium sp. CBMA 331]MUL99534.1 HAMP domain-containing histidine kinase [Mycolicibacterium sp. CBMA 334]MUM26552.1 HAMP domain-containing histidine kinase [Mycolicibacterium sp. CBMA 295]MUM37899.1 HAMP domain-containing histidine kinase [Mycolicibacterium 
MMSPAATRRLRLRPRPRHWGIATRSAIVAATVVLVALVVAGAGLTGLLNHYLISGIDEAAATRLYDVTTALRTESPPDVDGALLDTDQRVVAIQILTDDNRVAFGSTDAPNTPLVPVDAVGTKPTRLTGNSVPDDDLRIIGQRVDTPHGSYTVLVAGSSELAETTVQTVALLLCASAPLVIAVVAVATYLLVKRSLRSVDAIRARVAEISTSDLAERVPRPDSHDEIAALADTMNAMLARLETGHNAQRQFVGDASHELRSPLAAIISALDVAQVHPELLDQDLLDTTLIPEAQRMQSLIDDLLLLARADERGLKLRVEDLDLRPVIETEADRLRRGTRLTVHTDVVEARLSGDAQALSRMLRNLADNAARHAHSRIDISSREQDGTLVLIISDDGPGVPQADRLRVFDRFVRLDSDRSRNGGGTGLGLAIVSEIVAAHGGTVTMTDRPGGGTAVSVQLPIRRSSDSSR